MSKRVLQENKARQFFRKSNISYPLIRTRTPFFLITDELSSIKLLCLSIEIAIGMGVLLYVLNRNG